MNGNFNLTMQRTLKRKANRCFNPSICSTRRTIILICIVVILGYLQLFKYETDNSEDTKKVKDNFEFYSTTTTSHVPETTELLYKNQQFIVNYTAFDIEDNNKNDIMPFYNVQLKRIIREVNSKEIIFNRDRYGPLTNDSLIVVVQVHNRINYLRETIKSLSETHGIEKVLLIFSHDYYNTEINNVIKNITFCKTMQIFYPYSIQIYTNIFPGQSPYDCPPKITRQEAIKMNCINAEFPDQYGNYRNANFSQTKHHWWWKVNTVFDQLQAVRNYIGLILFIEEDHYMVKDFIYTLKLMQRKCPQSKLFSLGIHFEDNVIVFKNPQIHVSKWINNLGLSFNRSVWNELVQCADTFCHFDDYNWDWSLRNLAETCPGHTFWSSTLQNSRVYHIGKCGLHQHREKNCTDISHVTKLKENIMNLALYPETIDVTFVHDNQLAGTGFGGWGDPRDHKLCMQMTFHHKIDT